MKRIFAVALAVSLAAPAVAADVNDGPYNPQQVYEVPDRVNWSGFYVGGSVGYGILTVTPDGLPFGGSFESPLLSAVAGFDIARGRFVFGPFAEYTYITDDAAEDIDDWAVGARAGIVVAPRTLFYGSLAYAQLRGDGESVDGLRAGLGTEFAVFDNVFVDTKVNYTWYDADDFVGDADVGDWRALGGLKIKLNSGVRDLLR